MSLYRNPTVWLILFIVVGMAGYGRSGDCLVGAVCTGSINCPSSYLISPNVYCTGIGQLEAPLPGCDNTGDGSYSCWMPPSSQQACPPGTRSDNGFQCGWTVKGCVTNMQCP